MTYQNVIGFVHNSKKGYPTSWYDAADLYKKWAEKQEWARETLSERNDIPKWFKNGTAILDYPIRKRAGRGVHEQIPQLATNYSNDLGVTVTARPRGWEKHGNWIGPDIFPAYQEKRFSASVNSIKNHGGRLFLYLEGYQWMLNEPNYQYDGRDYFRKHCGDCAVQRMNGEYTFSNKGRVYAQGCRTTETAQEALYRNALKCVELGADALQIEVVGGGGQPCYNPKHDHPPGYGKWIYERFADLLQRVRTDGRKINPELALSIEEPCELYIPLLDAYNGRDFRELRWPRHIPHSRGIPLFTYIYHEYALGFSGYHWNFLTKGRQLYQYRNVAMNFVCGKINGFNILNRPEDAAITNHSAEARKFMRDTVRMTCITGNKYLLLGKMMRPPKVDCDTITFFYPDVRSGDKAKTNKGNWKESRVLYSAWQAPTGELGCVFANYTTGQADFNVSFPYDGVLDSPCKMLVHVPGKEVRTYQDVTMPFSRPFRLGPREIMLVELLPASENERINSGGL
ncbi:hypothetical protein DSCO28_64340 [Desulfosarcina ovata subsp. sediminis]|uniref:DUF6259 domain-containing protein n=2 Tax=Desulfosarcina ovata TaxID=83564 RepID=A0A5K8A095_9BACT|nr:hypothetical protein DSCO28_64340 [Desulfosarcina ovata subsp. sediminis]